MSSRFTEQETETYYDSEDAIYRSFWDEDGSVHWGVFDDNTGDDFLKASEERVRPGWPADLGLQQETHE